MRRASRPSPPGLSAASALPDEGRHRGRLPRLRRTLGHRRDQRRRRLRPQPSAPRRTARPSAGSTAPPSAIWPASVRKPPRRTNTSPGRRMRCWLRPGQRTQKACPAGRDTPCAAASPCGCRASAAGRPAHPRHGPPQPCGAGAGRGGKNISACWPTLWKRAAARCSSPTPSRFCARDGVLWREEAESEHPSAGAKKRDCPKF